MKCKDCGSTLCIYRTCGDECKDYVPNKGFEFLELKWEIEDNNPDKFKDELTAKEKILASFTTEELETELKRRMKL